MIVKTTGFLLRRRRMQIAPSVPASVTGKIVSFVSSAIQSLGITGSADHHTGKNLIETTLTSQTYRGIEFVVADDGTITADGETENSIGTGLVFGTVTLPPGTYKANGFTGTASAAATRMEVRHATTSTYYARVYLGNDIEFTLTEETPLRVIMVAGTGVEIHANIAFMIRRLGDASYDPYRAGNGSAALVGVNNLWTDGDSLTVDYKRFQWQEADA